MRHIILLVLPAVLWFPTTVGAVDEAVKEIGKGVLDAAFSEAEKRIIDRYYGDRLRRQAGQEQAEEQDADVEGERRDKSSKKGKNKKKGSDKAKSKSSRPGLAEEDGLPSGIRKKLQRGGELPPGIAKRGLPDDLESQLPPAPEGHERAVIDDKVVLIDATTGVIKDIFRPRGESGGDALTKRRRTQSEQTNSVDPQRQPAAEGASAKRWWEFWK